MSTLEHHATGRSLRAGLIVTAVWGLILCLWLWIDLSPWIAAALLAATLPAAWDFASARQAWLRLDDSRLVWGSGRTRGEIALDRIDHVRLETRLDLSVRVRVVPTGGGRRITLPQDALPGWAQLQQAFETRNIRTERHHFSLL